MNYQQLPRIISIASDALVVREQREMPSLWYVKTRRSCFRESKNLSNSKSAHWLSPALTREDRIRLSPSKRKAATDPAGQSRTNRPIHPAGDWMQRTPPEAGAIMVSGMERTQGMVTDPEV